MLKFLRSMRFGLLLLVVVCAFSLVGSLLPQGYPPAYYLETLGGAGQAALWLGFDHVFSSPGFLAALALLAVNLIFCSLSRFGQTRRAAKGALQAAAAAPAACTGDAAQMAALEERLAKKRFRMRLQDGKRVYYRNRFGFYGSFLVHLSFLLILVLGGLTLLTGTAHDYYVLPGETVALYDGSKLTVADFRVADETGLVDYVSHIAVTGRDGTVYPAQELSVNGPCTADGKKFFQQSYDVAGQLTITNRATGLSDVLPLTEPATFGVSSGTSLTFLDTEAVAGGTGLRYHVGVEEGGARTLRTVAAGERVTLAGVDFDFGAPLYYPGIRVKETAPVLMGALYAAFALMVVGLYLCFFGTPLYIAVGENGASVTGKDREGAAERYFEGLEGKGK